MRSTRIETARAARQRIFLIEFICWCCPIPLCRCCRLALISLGWSEALGRWPIKPIRMTCADHIHAKRLNWVSLNISPQSRRTLNARIAQSVYGSAGDLKRQLPHSSGFCASFAPLARPSRNKQICIYWSLAGVSFFYYYSVFVFFILPSLFLLGCSLGAIIQSQGFVSYTQPNTHTRSTHTPQRVGKSLWNAAFEREEWIEVATPHGHFVIADRSQHLGLRISIAAAILETGLLARECLAFL